MNNISYQDPSGPLISQNEYEFMCGYHYTPSTCTQPCTCTHVYHLSNNAVVDIMVYDKRMYDSLKWQIFILSSVLVHEIMFMN